jgi:hypothetical protein
VGRLVADEVVCLGTKVPDIAGGDLTLLGIERWGDACRLDLYWDGPDTDRYSPFYAHYLELVTDDRPTTVIAGSAGHIAGGFYTTHYFLAHRLPERFVLRRPAIDGGPPLVEIVAERA